MIVARLVRGVADHFILRLPEWLCSAIAVNYGLTLLQAGNTFDNPNFTVMRRFADENTWGVVIFGIGAVRFCALLINGSWPQFARWSPLVRSFSATVCAGVFFAASLGLFLASPSSPGWRTYGCLMITDIILAIFIAGSAGKAERRYRNGSS